MSARPEKQAIVAEIKAQMEQGRYVLAVGYKGLTVTS
jgi:ribosomal protein L10